MNSHPDNRECRKCKRVYPVDMFPVYRSKGYEGRRHQCRGCVRAARSRWEMELSPKDAKRYYARKTVTDGKYKRKERSERYHTRLMYLRNAVNALLGAGMTRKDIADRAGLNEKTIRRILNGIDGRKRFHQPTEERILALYRHMKEAEA